MTMQTDTCINMISGTGIALHSNDIDTDRIIPARFLKALTFNKLGEYVFFDERSQAAKKNQTHPFDAPSRKQAKILTVAKNFGCGSSREHAPQALRRWGIEAVIGESFGEIFRGNCASIGLACLTVSETDSDTIRTYVEQNPQKPIHIDLNRKSITLENKSLHFSLDESVRERFISGRWNLLTELLEHKKHAQRVYQSLPYTKNMETKHEQ